MKLAIAKRDSARTHDWQSIRRSCTPLSDDGALLKSNIVLGFLRRLGIIGSDGRRQLAVTTYCVHSFFDAYLKSPGVWQLKISSPLYPEIQVLE